MKLKFFRKVIHFFWPEMGWKRFLIYMYHRIGRTSGSPHHIACGFAWGAAISVTPFFGFHLLLSTVLAWLTGGAVFSAIIGTLIGNPWTFPFIFELTYYIGIHFIQNINFLKMNIAFTPLQHGLLTHILSLDSLFKITHRFWNIFIPLTIGGLIFMPFVWMFFYFLIKFFTIRYRRDRQRNRLWN